MDLRFNELCVLLGGGPWSEVLTLRSERHASTASEPRDRSTDDASHSTSDPYAGRAEWAFLANGHGAHCFEVLRVKLAAYRELISGLLALQPRASEHTPSETTRVLDATVITARVPHSGVAVPARWNFSIKLRPAGPDDADSRGPTRAPMPPRARLGYLLFEVLLRHDGRGAAEVRVIVDRMQQDLSRLLEPFPHRTEELSRETLLVLLRELSQSKSTHKTSPSTSQDRDSERPRSRDAAILDPRGVLHDNRTRSRTARPHDLSTWEETLILATRLITTLPELQLQVNTRESFAELLKMMILELDHLLRRLSIELFASNDRDQTLVGVIARMHHELREKLVDDTAAGIDGRGFER